MDEAAFDKDSREEIERIEEAFAEIDPDDVELTTSDGVLKLLLRDGTRVVINSHRAARQIWMAAISTAWHFDPTPTGWIASKSGEELRATLARLVHQRIGVSVAI